MRAASDKEVAASPALQALRDQVIGLEYVPQVLAKRLEAAKPSTAAAIMR